LPPTHFLGAPRYGALHRLVRAEEGADTVTIEKCGLCGGDPFKKDNLKDAVLRLIP